MTPKRVLALGEVLWDIFPDGPRFGGAPANFACAAAGLGGERVRVSLASAVGDDELGDLARRMLGERGVGTEYLATRDAPTGTVNVRLDAAGQATYAFADNPAWDVVPWTAELGAAAGAADVVYFGTLGQRGEAARRTIRNALRATPPECLRIFDVNLRSPYWDRDTIVEGLAMANVLKVNEVELPIVAEVAGASGSDEECLRFAIERFSLRAAALTRGSNGSLLLGRNGERSECPGEPVAVADTVGAGDAFTAALALGLAFDLPIAAINRWATKVAAFVCTQSGGTPRFPSSLHLSEVLKS